MTALNSAWTSSRMLILPVRARLKHHSRLHNIKRCRNPRGGTTCDAGTCSRDLCPLKNSSDRLTTFLSRVPGNQDVLEVLERREL